MFDEFKRIASPFLDLDWTKNSLAALWFAVRRPAISVDQKGAVWIFKLIDSDFIDQKEKSNPFSITKTKVFQPNHIAKRLIVQDGWFTAHGYSNKLGHFVALNKNIYYKERLTKLTIDADKFAKIRWDLNLCDVNSSTLFPELPGLCENINWDNSVLQDENNLPGIIRDTYK